MYTNGQTTPRRNQNKPKEPGTIRRRDIEASVNKDQRDARQRQAAAQRRQRVAALYHAGKTQEEIADLLEMGQSTVSTDLAKLRAQWQASASEQIGEWVMRELAYAVEQRESALVQWNGTHNWRMAGVVLQWSKRISDLLGLDAPTKVDDWTDKDWREYAKAQGLNEADVIAEAEQIIREAQGGDPVPTTGNSPTAPDTQPTEPGPTL